MLKLLNRSLLKIDCGINFKQIGSDFVMILKEMPFYHRKNHVARLMNHVFSS